VQLVYALGKLGYDFGSEARRDRFVQFMGPDSSNPSLPANAFDPARMVSYLGENPYEAESLIWTLNLDATPIYAIMPTGPFATVAYERLREGFVGQLRDGVEMVSIPGFHSREHHADVGPSGSGNRPCRARDVSLGNGAAARRPAWSSPGQRT
jgi:hypothetical protein